MSEHNRKLMWKNKYVEDMTREELIEAIIALQRSAEQAQRHRREEMELLTSSSKR
jgi:hypothetical protein